MHTGAHRVPARIGRRVAVVAATILALTMLNAFQAPAWAAATEVDRGAQIVLSGRVDVPAGETSGPVVVFHGPVTVDGMVDGAVVVFDGPVTVDGQITDDLVVFNGTVEVGGDGRVAGDVVSPREPTVANGATIGGELLRIRSDLRLRSLAETRLVSWLAVSVSTLALGLLLVLFAPRAADATAVTMRTAPGLAVAFAVGLAIGLPALAAVAVLTVVGIPFGIGVLLALALLYAVGYVTLGWLVGHLAVPRFTSRAGAFVVGWAVLRVVGLAPLLEAVAWFPGAALGFGVLCATAWAAQRSPAPVPAPGTHVASTA